ncbi:hypothetical protein [Cellulomonas sp. SG140]|uniref:hypothetical protein n=1 Tax=Cellulomonas sp. SG140 TaxID=2976536 RepID=UPI0021E75F29|nr:hypothetical protein [Cellulomonas sp. SG140]HEX2896328.1 hypothetical protein [Marmoricola sp.]
MRPTGGPSTEEKLTALHAQLVDAVAELVHSDKWAQMLTVAARFTTYSGGGVGVFERREFSPSCANPAIEWAQSGAHIAVETLAGVSDLDAAT